MKYTVKINGRNYTEEEYEAWKVANKERLASRFREMIESGTPPSANTDREFLLGHCNGSQFQDNESVGDNYAAVARQHGVDPKGKVYMGGLARFPGDPMAWVSGKGDAEAVIDANGWGSQGSIQRPVRNVVEPNKVALDPQIVQDEVEKIVDKMVPEGESALVDRVDLAEQVYNRQTAGYETETFEPSKHCPQFAAAAGE